MIEHMMPLDEVVVQHPDISGRREGLLVYAGLREDGDIDYVVAFDGPTPPDYIQVVGSDGSVERTARSVASASVYDGDATRLPVRLGSLIKWVNTESGIMDDCRYVVACVFAEHWREHKKGLGLGEPGGFYLDRIRRTGLTVGFASAYRLQASFTHPARFVVACPSGVLASVRRSK